MSDTSPRPSSLFKRTLRWAWQRDEVERTATKQTVIYTITLYAVTFIVLILLGAVVAWLGQTAAGAMIWIFGTAYTAFIGSMEIGWEVLEYWNEQRDDPVQGSEPDRELSPGFRLSNDTKFGFIVTVIALVTLLTTIQVAIHLSVYL